jgi:hypothetical protein
MPEPLYIMCSQSSEVDKNTHLLNLYGVAEVVGIYPIPVQSVNPVLPGQPNQAPLSLHINTGWLRLPTERDTDMFDCQLFLRYPDNTELLVGETQFSFEGRIWHRLTGIGDMPFLKPGVVRVFARVRRASTNDPWVQQSYPFYVIEIPNPTPPTISAEQVAGSSS